MKNKSLRKLRKGGRIPYFAYGSNLDLPGMAQRTPTAERGPAATLKDWKLVFRGVADIEKSEGSETVGGLWFIDEAGLNELDRYEGYPYMYDREWVQVKTEGARKLRALTYVMTDQRDGTVMMPSGFYLNSIKDGYNAFGLELAKLGESVSAAYEEVDARVGYENLVPDGKKRMKAPWQPKTGKKMLETAGMSPATKALYELEDRVVAEKNGDRPYPGEGQIAQGYTDTDENWLADTVWDVRCSGIPEDRVMDIVMETLDEFRGTTPEADEDEDDAIGRENQEALELPAGVRVA